MITQTNKFILAAAIMLAISCSGSGEKPTKDDITTVMKANWEKPASSTAPKTDLTINEITLGDSQDSNYAQQLEGIPENVTVTAAKIDFTQNTYYDSGIQKVRRIMTADVYKDKFDQWAVMNTGTVYPPN